MNDAWSLEAMVSRFTLHPDLQEVYVEGDGDVGFYQSFIEATGRGDVLVYPIDAVAVPFDKCEMMGLNALDRGSKRTNVIILAMTIEKETPKAAESITCIADADMQFLCPVLIDASCLWFTDYTSIEMYAFRAYLVTKLLRIAAPNAAAKGDDVLKKIAGVLEKLFSFRVANQVLQWGLSWVDPLKNFKYSSGTVLFDEAQFVKRYLNTKGRLKRESEFWKEVGRVRSRFGAEPRRQIRGHDYIGVLVWYLKQLSNRAFREFTASTLRHSLLSQLRVSDLSSEPLFSDLMKKYPAVPSEVD